MHIDSSISAVSQLFIHSFMDEFRSSKPAELHRTVSHEVAHGAFVLYHTFSEFPALQQGTTDNLMDYATGTRLSKYQWDLIHDPVWLIVGGGSEEEGAMEGECPCNYGIIEGAEGIVDCTNMIYFPKTGDQIEALAKRFRTTVDYIKELNETDLAFGVFPYDLGNLSKIKLPPCQEFYGYGTYHVVRKVIAGGNVKITREFVPYDFKQRNNYYKERGVAYNIRDIQADGTYNPITTYMYFHKRNTCFAQYGIYSGDDNIRKIPDNLSNPYLSDNISVNDYDYSLPPVDGIDYGAMIHDIGYDELLAVGGSDLFFNWATTPVDQAAVECWVQMAPGYDFNIPNSDEVIDGSSNNNTNFDFNPDDLIIDFHTGCYITEEQYIAAVNQVCFFQTIVEYKKIKIALWMYETYSNTGLVMQLESDFIETLLNSIIAQIPNLVSCSQIRNLSSPMHDFYVNNKIAIENNYMLFCHNYLSQITIDSKKYSKEIKEGQLKVWKKKDNTFIENAPKILPSLTFPIPKE